MTTAIPEDLARSVPDERTRKAWATYRDNLTGLDGRAYDEAERAEWEHLQTELREACDQATAGAAGA